MKKSQQTLDRGVITNRITDFPTPLPDEILYSVIARYHFWSRNRRKDTLKELFNDTSINAVIGLPKKIREFCDRLPDNKFLPKDIIEKNTIFPALRPFLSPGRSERILNLMLNDGKRINNALGIYGKTVPEFLRYCPSCFHEDEKTFGEPYWHRVHQLHGVFCCPYHAIPLKDSTVNILFRHNRGEFIPLSYRVVESGISNQDLEDIQYVNIAKMYNYLLASHIAPNSPEDINRRYKYYLSKKGLVTYGGKVRLRELYLQLKDFYSAEFLERMNCAIRDSHDNTWISRIVNSKQYHCTTLHLVLINYLGVSLKAFFKQNNEYLPFGTGPWKCLNPFCENYKKPTIMNCAITKNSNTLKPLGRFTCSTCGFDYNRNDSDDEMNKQEKVSKINDYGDIWRQQVQDLYDNGKTISYIASIAKTSIAPVRNALGLNKKRIKRRKVKLLKPKMDFYDRLKKLVMNNPDITRSELRSLDPSAYQTIRKRDPEWFKENMPQPKRRDEYTFTRVDWKSRDEEISMKVLQAADKLKVQDGHIQRISLQAIIRESKVSLAIITDKRLFRTKEILTKVIESKQDYDLRKLQYNVRKSIEKFNCINKRYILSQCNFHNPSAPEIKETLEAFIEIAATKDKL